MSTLLDANVLIALVVADHVHHDAAEAWLVDRSDSFASCPITQSALVRMLLREGHTAAQAQAVVAAIAADRRHEFWPDEISFVDVRMTGVIGHRQVTDAYLAELARRRSSRLATFDRGLAGLHSDVVELVATGRGA